MIERWRAWPPYARRVSVRLAFLPLVLFVLYSAMFVLLEVWYDPLDGLITIDPTTPQRRADFNHAYGRDDPMLRRYEEFWRNVVTLDFGPTYFKQLDTAELVRHRVGPTAELLALTLGFGAAIAVGAAVAVAAFSCGWRVAVAALGAACAAVPVTLALILLIVLPSRWWGYAPPIGPGSSLGDVSDNVRIMVPPAFVLAVACAGWSLPPVLATLRAAKDATARVVQGTAVALATMLPLALSGVIVIEIVFLTDGLGNLLKTAAYARDAPLAEATLTPLILISVLAWVIAPPAHGPRPDATRPPHLRSAHGLIVSAALALIALYALLGVVGPWIAPHDPNALSATNQYLGSSFRHPFGTDQLGRDIFSATLAAFRGSVKFTAFAIGFGFVPGAIAGLGLRRFAGSRALWAADAASPIAMLPFVPLAVLFVVAFGSTSRSEAAAVAVIAFAMALAASAASRDALALRTGLAATCASAVAIAIFTELMLSLIGLHSSFRPDWGQLLYDAATRSSWHWLGPAIVVTLATFGFLLLRAALDDDVAPLPYER